MLLPIVKVLGIFFVAYPLVALLLAGVAAEPEMVLSLVVWLVVTLIGTLLLGTLTFCWWRWQTFSSRLTTPVRVAEG